MIPQIIALESSKVNGRLSLRDSEGYQCATNKPDTAFEFLTTPYEEDSFKIVWDMEQFLKPILQLLPKDVVSKLNHGERAFYNATKLFWGFGKGQVFGVNYRKHINGNFYEEELDSNIYQLKTFFPDKTPACLNDIKVLGKELIQTLHNMGIKPKSLTSPASIIAKEILSKMYLPSIYNMPEDALECAEWAANYIREWRATYKLGKWDVTYDYDCTAAYSSILATLPNLRYAEYCHTDDGTIPDGIYWGILKGQVTIEKDVSPIIHSDGRAYKGTYPDFITTDDWQCIRRWNIGDFTPEQGWFIKLSKEVYPFRYLMQKLYSYRGNNDLKDWLSKHMSNTIWGKFCERRGDEFGEFYFPIYASMVTSKMRVADCDFIYANNLQDDLVSVIVDGCLSLKEAPAINPDRKFGRWRLNGISPAVVMGDAWQWLLDKRPLSKSFDEILAEMKSHPMKRAYGGLGLRFIEHSQNFTELPKTGSDLLNHTYNSKPYTSEELVN